MKPFEIGILETGNEGEPCRFHPEVTKGHAIFLSFKSVLFMGSLFNGRAIWSDKLGRFCWQECLLTVALVARLALNSAPVLCAILNMTEVAEASCQLPELPWHRIWSLIS